MKIAFRRHPRRMQTRMDAAGAMDAQNAPTAPWKTAQNAVSHSAHTHHRFGGEEDRREKNGLTASTASHTKFLTLPAWRRPGPWRIRTPEYLTFDLCRLPF